jgi:signal transduction histidine kinase
MTDSNPFNGARQHVTFHARVAGVALVTTIAVLMAACLTFLLQQWAVAREQTRVTHHALTQITAELTAPSLAAGDAAASTATLSVLSHAPRVISARLTDASGRTVASFDRPGVSPAPSSTNAERVAVMRHGQRVGEIVVVVQSPTIAGLAPQFIALTAALFFGGGGVALFLARGLAHRIIAPVQSMSDAMHEVAASGRFEPIEIPAQDALFRSLTDSFNHLLSKLDARERDLQRTLSELVEARDAANTANVLKSQFLANMSHEIRTPLNGVLAMAEVMAMGDLAPAQRERLDVIRQSGGLLLSVLNDVLDLSKIEAGKLTLSEDAFDLERILAPAREASAVMAKARGLDFRLKIEDSARGWWRGDADRLRQILGNLISNAVKFTQDGEISVVFDTNPATQALRFTVSDTGVGIPAEKLPTLFEKFTQADNSATRRFGGTGLGLAICRELTQMMGGAIMVSSREGEGSSFTVELPLSRAEAVAEEILPADGEEADMGALRILAAEDNQTNQRVLSAVMGSLGIEVEIVGDGRGKPMVILHGGAARRAGELGLVEWSVSLTHEREYAVAFVVAQ